MNDTILSHHIIVLLCRCPGGWRHLSHARGNQPCAQWVLLLDELPEFNRSVLEVMRQGHRPPPPHHGSHRLEGNLDFSNYFNL